VQRLVADAYGVGLADLLAPTRRTAAVAAARQTAMYLARVVFGWTYRDIADAFGRDPRTVAYACRRVEERRDDAATEAAVARLETACGALTDGSAR
jgi:chromosomal replication initiation ATPase DnaA